MVSVVFWLESANDVTSTNSNCELREDCRIAESCPLWQQR